MLTRKLAKYLLLAADFAAINVALAIVFWLHYRGGWAGGEFVGSPGTELEFAL